MKFHFDWMADRFREGKGLAPRAFYYDSFENTGNWAPERPDRFKQWRGYHIHTHAPALGGAGGPEEVRRVMCDYRETLSDLLLECVRSIVKWGEERGSGLRMQAHGAPAKMEILASWTTLADPEAQRFAGAASYSTSVTLPSKSNEQWLLDLGDVRDSARVRVNGKAIGVLVAHPFRLDVSGLLKTGANRIEIEVTNLGAYRKATRPGLGGIRRRSHTRRIDA